MPRQSDYRCLIWKMKITTSSVAFILLSCIVGAAAYGSSYESALELHAAGRYSAATIELRNALQESPEDVPARVLLGVVLLEQGKLREAAAELEKGLGLGGDRNLILVPLGQIYLQLLEPKSVLSKVIPPGTDPIADGEILLLHGDAALLLGDLGYAEKSYADTRERLPRDARPLLGEARVALARGQEAVADEKIASAIEIDPDSAAVWTLKGMVHRDRAQYDLARKALDRALELDPKSTKALGARAALLLDLGEQTAAAVDIDELRAINPSDLEGLYLQSWLLVSNNEHERAKALLQETAQSLSDLSEEHREKIPQTELLFGIVNFLTEDYTDAIENFSAFLARFPGHSGATRYLAATYLAAGDWDQVIRTLNPAQGDELPADPAILSLLAKAFRISGNSKQAIKAYERALEIAPGQPDFALGLATSRFAAGNTEVAIAALEQLIQKTPEFHAAQVELVSMYGAVGRLPDALVLARQLAAAEANSAPMQNLLGAILMETGHWVDAKKYFLRAEKLDPNDILARLNQARLAWRMEQPSAAIEHYRSALKQMPDSSEAQLELAEALIAQSDIDGAAELVQTLLERDRLNAKGRLADLWIQLARGELEDVTTDIYELLQDLPGNIVVQLGVARLYRAIGDLDNARLWLRRAGETAGFKADPLYEIAREQLALGDASDAQWSLTKALNGNPRHLGALAYRVRVLLGLDRLDDAKEAWANLNAIYPQRSETHLAAGDLLRADGELAAAIVKYDLAYRTASTRTTVRSLFEAQVESGDVAAALRTIRVWILLHPDDLESRHSLAEKLISVGQYRPAQLVYEGILKRTEDDPFLLNNLAFVAQKLGDDRAIEYAMKAIQIAPDQPRFLDTYGWILAENGEPERGLEILRDAFSRQSTNQEIRYHIALALLRMERTGAARRELDAALISERDFSSRAEAKILFENLGGGVD